MAVAGLWSLCRWEQDESTVCHLLESFSSQETPDFNSYRENNEAILAITGAVIRAYSPVILASVLLVAAEVCVVGAAVCAACVDSDGDVDAGACPTDDTGSTIDGSRVCTVVAAILFILAALTMLVALVELLSSPKPDPATYSNVPRYGPGVVLWGSAMLASLVAGTCSVLVLAHPPPAPPMESPAMDARSTSPSPPPPPPPQPPSLTPLRRNSSCPQHPSGILNCEFAHGRPPSMPLLTNGPSQPFCVGGSAGFAYPYLPNECYTLVRGSTTSLAEPPESAWRTSCGPPHVVPGLSNHRVPRDATSLTVCTVLDDRYSWHTPVWEQRKTTPV